MKGIMLVMLKVDTRALLALDQRIHKAAVVLAEEGPASVEERIHLAAVELAGSGLISVEGATDFLTRMVEPRPMERSMAIVDTWENLPPPVARDFYPEGPWRPGMPRLPAFLRHRNERHQGARPARGRYPLARPGRRVSARAHPRRGTATRGLPRESTMYADHTFPTLAFSSSSRLPVSFQFLAYLPGRGVRALVATVTDCNPTEANLGDVSLCAAELLARREGARLQGRDEDAALEAAGDFLEALCQGVSLQVAQAASAEQAVSLQRRARTEAQEDGEPLDYQHFS